MKRSATTSPGAAHVLIVKRHSTNHPELWRRASCRDPADILRALWNQVRPRRHRFHAAGDDDLCVAKRDPCAAIMIRFEAETARPCSQSLRTQYSEAAAEALPGARGSGPTRPGMTQP